MPDKSPDAFRTISEVADWLGVQPHVLRFWESKFSQVRPVKRAGGRRYYRPNDMLLLGGIRKLLHEDGLTIKGAQKVLREEGMSHVARMSQPLDPESAALSDLDVAEDSGQPEAVDFGTPPAREEAGKVLQFGSAEGTTPEPEPQPATENPEAEPAPPLSRPDLSGTPEPKPESDPAPSQSGVLQEETEKKHDAAGSPDEPSASDASEAPIPSFRRSSSVRRPPEPKVPEPAAEPRQSSPSDRLPSFLQQPQETPDPVPDDTEDREKEVGADAAQASGTEASLAEREPQPEAPAVPKPRIVDVPDPDESAFELSSGALSACFSASRLTADRRAEILPLVAQLAALRDRMATSRGR